MSDRKYLDGDIVLINKFWTTEGGGQMLKGKAIKAKVISADKTYTLGWTYKLSADRPLHVCYCDDDILYRFEEGADPEYISKVFGDQ
jgi:hypothetical protein